MKTLDEALEAVLMISFADREEMSDKILQSRINFSDMDRDMRASCMYLSWLEEMCADSDLNMESAISTGFINGMRVGMEMERVTLNIPDTFADQMGMGILAEAHERSVTRAQVVDALKKALHLYAQFKGSNSWDELISLAQKK